MSDFKFTWQVSDGYAGGARPQHASISLDDFEDDMTDADILERLEQIVQDDFEQKASASWSDREQERLLKWVKDGLAGHDEE
jgi:hypothetical protein